MEASPNPRRGRYTPQPSHRALVLTPTTRALLHWIAELKIVSLPQLARLMDVSEQGARRQLRPLFDGGFVKVVAIPRAALASPTSANDAHLLFGSAPNLYVLTRAGQRRLYQEGIIEQLEKLPHYGPTNSLFLAHELLVNDARVWLTRCARAHPDHHVECWHDGKSAAIDLERVQVPKVLCPDAWFIYRMGEQRLVAFLEVDRGTERGGRRWHEKLSGYTALWSGDRLRITTGYVNARILVVTTSSQRRAFLSGFLAKHAPPILAARCWLTDHAVFADFSFRAAIWQRPGHPGLQPFLTASVERDGIAPTHGAVEEL